MSRPKITDPAVEALAVAQLNAAFRKDYPEMEDAEDDFRGLLQFHRHGDGYELAKALDAQGWDVDFDLCEWLEHKFSVIVDNALREHVKAWAKSQSFPYAIGDAVQFTRAGKPGHGEIVEVHLTDAKATIYCPHLGHVREGVGTHGFIVPWENIHQGDAE